MRRFLYACILLFCLTTPALAQQVISPPFTVQIVPVAPLPTIAGAATPLSIAPGAAVTLTALITNPPTPAPVVEFVEELPDATLVVVGEAATPPYSITINIGQGVLVPTTKTYRARIKDTVVTTPLASLPLVHKLNLVWTGAFLGPEWNPAVDGSSIGYGGWGMAYNPAHNTLFVVGKFSQSMVAEMSIPALSRDIATAPRSVYLQPYAEITEGKFYGDEPGGLLVSAGKKLIFTTRIGYDANYSQNAAKVSHFISGTTLSTLGDVKGPLEVTAEKTNYVSGYMASVPLAWQAALGGPALTGWCCGPSIISRTSWGPALSAFDPDALGVTMPVPGSTLLYYPVQHQTLGCWCNSGPWPPVAGQGVNEVYNGTVIIYGVAMPAGTRSVLFFGKIGYGVFCYGDTIGDIDRVWTNGTEAENGGQRFCAFNPGPRTGHSYYAIDPAHKGAMAPYHYQVWAYDALDLAAVKAGTKQPWDVVPYDYWTLDDVPGTDSGRVGDYVAPRAVAVDQAAGRIYLYQQRGENPVIHAFTVTFP